MKKFSKAQRDDLDSFCSDLRELAREVEAHRDDLKETIEEKWSNLEDAVRAYNQRLEDLASFRDQLVADMESHYDDRSEKWQESDAGRAYDDWRDEWEHLDLSELELGEMPQIDLDDPTHADDVDALPTEPQE